MSAMWLRDYHIGLVIARFHFWFDQGCGDSGQDLKYEGYFGQTFTRIT